MPMIHVANRRFNEASPTRRDLTAAAHTEYTRPHSAPIHRPEHQSKCPLAIAK
jgi:hypothetical protein